ALLHLQAPGKDIHQPRDLAEANHMTLGNVGDMTLAEERQQMMLAEAVEIDVLHDDHLAVVDREEGVVEDVVDVGVVAARQELERLFHPYGRPAHTPPLPSPLDP